VQVLEDCGECSATHRRFVNVILSLLCKEHFPSLVEYAGVVGPAYTFDQYAAAPDIEDQDGRVFTNKVERVKQELWVSTKYIAFIAHS
jgi:hypothetical protein